MNTTYQMNHADGKKFIEVLLETFGVDEAIEYIRVSQDGTPDPNGRTLIIREKESKKKKSKTTVVPNTPPALTDDELIKELADLSSPTERKKSAKEMKAEATKEANKKRDREQRDRQAYYKTTGVIYKRK